MLDDGSGTEHTRLRRADLRCVFVRTSFLAVLRTKPNLPFLVYNIRVRATAYLSLLQVRQLREVPFHADFLLFVFRDREVAREVLP